MLQNPGPDTEGKHLNLVSFTKTTFTRKFGIKTIALKQCKAFLTCLQTKKAQENPRVRFFSDLYGLPSGERTVPEKYSEEVRTSQRVSEASELFEHPQGPPGTLRTPTAPPVTIRTQAQGELRAK